MIYVQKDLCQKNILKNFLTPIKKSSSLTLTELHNKVQQLEVEWSMLKNHLVDQSTQTSSNKFHKQKLLKNNKHKFSFDNRKYSIKFVNKNVPLEADNVNRKLIFTNSKQKSIKNQKKEFRNNGYGYKQMMKIESQNIKTLRKIGFENFEDSEIQQNHKSNFKKSFNFSLKKKIKKHKTKNLVNKFYKKGFSTSLPFQPTFLNKKRLISRQSRKFKVARCQAFLTQNNYNQIFCLQLIIINL